MVYNKYQSKISITTVANESVWAPPKWLAPKSAFTSEATLGNFIFT